MADLRLCKNFTVPNETKQNQAHLQVALGFPRQGLEIYVQPRPVAVTKARKGEDPKIFWGAIKVSHGSSSDPKNTWEQDSLRPLVFECVCLACEPNASNRQALLLHKCARLKLWSNTCNSKVLWDCQSKLQLIKHQSVGDPGPRHRQTHCDHSNHSHQHKQHMPKKSKNVGIIAFPCCCNYLCKRDHEILPGFGSLDIEIVVRCCCTVAHNKTSNQTHVWICLVARRDKVKTCQVTIKPRGLES